MSVGEPFRDDVVDGIGIRSTGDPEAPTILFLHGLGGSRTAWDTVMASLADRAHCVAWDMPGYGVSRPLVPLTFGGIAEAARRVLDGLGVGRAHVVGLSFGGQQAQHLALAHPGRIDRLVLADTSAVFGADGTDVGEWKARRLDPLDRGVTPAEMAASVVRAITAPGFGGPEFDRAVAAFSRISSDGLRATVDCLPTHDTRSQLARIEAPTLVIVGELDEETPRSYAEALVRAIPGSHLVVIEGVGHLTPSEAPAQFARHVAEHLFG